MSKRDGRERRQRQPHRDARHRVQNAGAAHACGFLVFGIGLGEHRRQQEESKRRPQKPFDQDHAGHGIDVEARQPDRGDEIVERPVAAEQKQPGDDIEHERRAERDDRGEIGEGLERRIGALDQPRHQAAEGERDRHAAEAEDQRIEQAAEELPVGQELPVIGEGEIAGRAGHRRGVQAAVEQKNQRRHDQDQQRERQHRDHGPCRIGRGGGGLECAGTGDLHYRFLGDERVSLSPRAGRGRGEGALPLGWTAEQRPSRSESRGGPLTLLRFAQSTSPRAAGRGEFS